MADAKPKEDEKSSEKISEEPKSMKEPPSDVFNKGFIDNEPETIDETTNEKSETDLESLPIYALFRDFYKIFTEDGPNLLKFNDSKADEIWKTTAYTIQERVKMSFSYHFQCLFYEKFAFRPYSLEIKAAEALLRLDKKSILGSLPVRKDKAIEMAVRACVCQSDLGLDRSDDCAANEFEAHSKMVSNKLLHILFPNPKSVFDHPSLLACDIFHCYLLAVLLFKSIEHKKVDL